MSQRMSATLLYCKFDFWLFCLGLLSVSYAQANEIEVSPFDCKADLPASSSEQVITSLEQKYSRVLDLTANFQQTDTIATTETKTEASGQVYFRKPGMMDWHYEKPRGERFVSDGVTLWYHQPELNQVQLFNFLSSFSSDLPVSFLLGLGSLRESFSLVKGCRGRDGNSVLELNPKKEDNSLVHFYLSVDKESFPTAARIVKRGGNMTEIVLEDRVFDKGLQPSQFAFKFPKGVASLDRRAPVSEPARPIKEKALEEKTVEKNTAEKHS